MIYINFLESGGHCLSTSCNSRESYWVCGIERRVSKLRSWDGDERRSDCIFARFSPVHHLCPLNCKLPIPLRIGVKADPKKPIWPWTCRYDGLEWMRHYSVFTIPVGAIIIQPNLSSNSCINYLACAQKEQRTLCTLRSVILMNAT
jgi:hypothetical protein